MSGAALARQRDRSLSLARSTAIAGRFAGLALQLFSLPVAARALGSAGFVHFSMATATLGFLMMANIGVGPAMALRMAYRRGQSRAGDSAMLFATAWWTTLILSLACGAVVAALFFVAPGIVASAPAGVAGREVTRVLGVVVALFLISSPLTIVEQAQLAFQRQHRANIAQMTGTLAAAVLVLLVARFAPSTALLLIAVYAPLLFFRCANALQFLAETPDLLGGRFSRATMRDLVREGLAMSAGSTLSHFLAHLLPILLFGVWLEHDEAARLSALMNALVLCTTGFAIIHGPLAGAYPDARARGDLRWIRRQFWGATLATLGIGIGVCLVLSVAGQLVFRIWYHGAIVPGEAMLIWAGVYFVALAAERALYSFVLAFEKIDGGSIAILARSVAGAALFGLFGRQIGAEAVFLVLACCTILLSVLPLVWMTARIFAGSDARMATA